MTAPCPPRPVGLPAALLALLIAAPVGAAPAVQSPAPSAKASTGRVLQQAYQKEFAFLSATKRQLKARIAEIEADLAREDKASAAELAALEHQLLVDQQAADTLERELQRATQRADAVEALDLDDLLQQVNSERQKLGGGPLALVADEASDEGASVTAVQAALADLHRLSAAQNKLQAQPGVFFDAAGKKLEGTVYRLGGLAAWGVNDDVAGPLAPAGNGAFKLWPESSGRGVRELAAGQPPALVDTFLFASEAHAVDVKKEKQPLEIVRAGGSVAWVIVGLGALAMLLIVLRAALLVWMGRGRQAMVDATLTQMRAGQASAALGRCKDRAGALGDLLATAIHCAALPRASRAEVLDEALLRVLPKADRFGAIIIVIAAASPLLGLLGTVSGMISTFDVITEHGTGDPRMLSGGISEALITTELGLIVAIPALFFGNLLMGWGDRLKRDLESGALAVAYGDDLDGQTEDGAEPALDGARA